jgi:tRNA-specific 2-thiouridylase
MPLGDYDKEEIRKIAEQEGLPVAHKPDSQDICFVPDGDYAKFLTEYTGEELIPGDYIDSSGNILGRHKGISAYTIGQRKGLNLAMGHPVYVTGIDAENNRVVIGENEELFKYELIADNVSFMSVSGLSKLSSLLNTTPIALLFSVTRLCIHKPKPARVVVKVGTPKAKLSIGVYPQGS